MKIMTVSVYYIAFLLLISACSERNIPPDQESNAAFLKSEQTLGNTRTFGLSFGDVDQDNDLDVVFANYIGTSKLWLNNGDGSFELSGQVFSADETHDVAMEDLNNDHYPDIIMVCHSGKNKIYLNDGDGTFTESQQDIGSSDEAPQYIYTSDLDNDGDMDFMVYNYRSANAIWMNDGNGSFTKADADPGGSNAKGFHLADLNDDGYPDLFIKMRDLPNKIWYNDKKGAFSISGTTVGSSCECADCVDFDGDGDMDLLISDATGVMLCLNENNSGEFSQEYVIKEQTLDHKALDADGDGDYDLVTCHLTNGNKLWLNDGAGQLTTAGTVFGTNRVLSLKTADLDNDNDTDIVFGQLEGTNGNAVYLNQSVKE